VADEKENVFLMNNQTLALLNHKIELIVSASSPWVANGMGRCDTSKSQIHIKEGMPSDVQGSIFIHELVHYIADMNGIDLSEQTVNNLALGFFSFLKSNPEFIKELLD
jgi:hypothetical protein